MKLFPAIDIKDGKCVRLVQGDFQQVKIYHENPVEMAKSFKIHGCTNLHVVDLDGARLGTGTNGEVIERIVKETGLSVQVGGGIRSIERIQAYLDVGVSRVILGTVVVEEPDFLEEAIVRYGQNVIIVSVDAKEGKVATHGWEHVTEIDSYVFCQQLERKGVKTIVYTDISKDGMLIGPNFQAYEKLKQETNLQVIASGGVSSLDDLKKLQQLHTYGAITGKALYEGRFTLEEAIQCLQNESFPV